MVKVTRVTERRAPSKGSVVIATGKKNEGFTVPNGTSTDAAAALVGRYQKLKKKSGCCPGKRSY